MAHKLLHQHVRNLHQFLISTAKICLQMEVATISHGMGCVLSGEEIDGHIIRTIRLHRVYNREVANIALHLIVLVHIRGNIEMSTSSHRQRSLSYIETI